MPPLRILIADDHQAVRNGIRGLLSLRPDWSVCGEAASGQEAIEQAKALHPDLVLMDITMPEMDGVAATVILSRDLPEIPVLLISQNDPELVRKAAEQVGAKGFIQKSRISQDLFKVVDEILGDGKASILQDSTKLKKTSGSRAHHLDFLPDSGDIANRMRSLDWSRTPLGPIERWPQSLKTSVSICLASRFPIVMYWGPEYVVLYNDAYGAILGSKHPWALGRTCRECWAEIWDTIGPMLDGVVKLEKATWSDDLLLLLQRHGYPEECYFSFSFSPVRIETGAVGGVFTAVMETTEKVIGERRLRTLRDLAAHAVKATSERDAWRIAGETLAENLQCIPFSVFCRVGPEKTVQVLNTAGISPEHPLCTFLGTPGSSLSELVHKVAQSREAEEVNSLRDWPGELPRGKWEVPPDNALLLPIIDRGQERVSGVLLAGVNPHKRLDDSYRTFFRLVAHQIATSVADARSHDDERKRVNALAELDRAKTLFFSNVSHEFRTPLTLMLGPLEDALAARDGLGPEQRESLEVAHRNSLRLLKLVNTLLDFSRIEAGRIQACYEPVDLPSLTLELASIFRSAVERAGLRFVVNCPPIADPTYVDREMWEKIVFNLLSNALKFTFSGEIELSLQKRDGVVELAVRDTGTGIAQDEVPHLFERFYRVTGARGRTFEGSGIGLSLVQELAKLHGGSVRVNSEPDRGSTFTVSIPLGKDHLPAEHIGAARTLERTGIRGEAYVQEVLRWVPQTSDVDEDASMAAMLGSVKSTEQHKPQKGIRSRVLVADDNADMRGYLQRLLGEEYEVEVVANGEDALRAAHARRPDLIVSDMMMPRLDGAGLLLALRSDEVLKSIPVILLSARAGDESRIAGLEFGADDYLVKPFSARELLARVGSQISMAKIRLQAAERERELRKEAENERNRMRELFMQAPTAIAWLSGPEHRWSFMNSEYLKVTGRQRAEDFIGKTIRESLPEIQGQGFLELLDEVYRTGVPYVGTEAKVMLNRAANGEREPAFFNFVYQPMRNRDEAVEGILVHAVDVTQQALARRQLEERERASSLLAAIVDSTDDAIVSKSLDGIITSWNKSAERMFGYAADEAIGQHITLIIPPERHQEEAGILARLRRGEQLDHFETVRRRKDGTTIDLSLTISPVVNANGKVIGASKVARDITKRKQAEKALADAARQQKALFQLADKLHRAPSLEDIYAAALDAICEALQCERASILLYDDAGVMRFVKWRGLSDGYRALVEGHSPWKRDQLDPQAVCVPNIESAQLDEGLKAAILAENICACAFIPLVSNLKLIGKFMAYFAEPRMLSADEIELSLTIARQLAFSIERKAAEERERQITAEAVAAQENYRKLAETLDGEVRSRTRELEKRNADVLRQSEQLRELSYRLLQVQDEERRHIARELHDSAGQTLAVLGMNLAQLVQKAERKSPELAPEAEKIQDWVQQLHREIRTASYLLHPPLLDESGLSSALAWYSEGVMERSGLDVRLDIAKDFGRLPADMELVIFRLAQECLTNIHRHSGSKTASIRVARESGSLVVNIEDTGNGMSAEKLAEIQSQGSGVGIRGMRERLRQFGGTLKIESGRSGTKIIVTVPLPSVAIAAIPSKTETLPAAV